MEINSLNGFHLVNLDAGKKDGSTLREKRVLLGMTQKQVAEKAKVPLASYQRFESNDRNIRTASFQLACRVIEALDMDITAFYHGEYLLSAPLEDRGDGVLRYAETGRPIDEDVTE